MKNARMEKPSTSGRDRHNLNKQMIQKPSSHRQQSPKYKWLTFNIRVLIFMYDTSTQFRFILHSLNQRVDFII